MKCINAQQIAKPAVLSKENPVNNESSLGQSGRAGRTPESVSSEQSQYFVAFFWKTK